MKENKILVAIAALLIIGMTSVFTVHETEKAIKLKTGEITKADYQPGIHFKWPFLDTVKKFDGRVQALDFQQTHFLTDEKKTVIVDFYVKWQISDVKTFYTVTAGKVNQSNLGLSKIIDASLSKKHSIKDLVSTDRKAIQQTLFENSQETSTSLGVKILDMQIKRIYFAPDAIKSVFSKMAADQAQIARNLRLKGAEKAEEIRSDADKQRIVILADSLRDAEKLHGEGDAKAAEIYATSYGADAEFFAFYRSMSAYKAIFSDSNRLIVIDPNSDFFKYFKKQQ